MEHCHAACELGKTLLKLLAVVVAGGLGYLGLDLGNAGSDAFLVAVAVHDGGVLLVHSHAVCMAEILKSGLVKLHALFFGNHSAACEDSNILEHFLAAVAEAGSLYSANLERAAQAVHNECCERVLVDVFSHDKQRASALCCRFENRKNVLEVRYFLVVDKDQRAVHHALHLLCVGNEVGRDVATVELHAFNHLDSGFGALGLVHCDYSFLLHLLHSLGNESAYGFVVIGRHASHVFDFLEVVAHFLSHRAYACHNGSHSLVDTALEVHRVGTGSNVLKAYGYDSLSEHGGGGCSVAGIVAGLGGNFLHKLCAHVAERLFKLYLAGNAHTVLGDMGSAELLAYDNVAAFRAEGDLNGVGKSVDTLFELFASLDIEFNVFCHFVLYVSGEMCLYSMLADYGENLVLAHDEHLFAIELDFSTGILAIEHAVAFLKNHFFVLCACANGENCAFEGLFFSGIRNYDTGHGYFFSSCGLYDNAVCEWFEFHDCI